MRYLTAKGLLAGLSVLACQLRASLIPTGSADDSAASASSGSRSRPSSPARQRPLLVLRRKAPIAGASLPISPPRSPLLRLARRVAELIEAVVSHPRMSPESSRPSPESSSVFAGGWAPPPAPVAPTVAVSHGDVVIEAPAAATPSYPAPLAVAAATGGASAPRLGAIRALGPLMSLLVGMLGAELDPSQQLRPRSRSSPTVDGGRKNPRQVQILAATATAAAAATPLSDGLLRLAYVVVRAANRACAVDLHATQVCLRVCSAFPRTDSARR